MELEEAKKLVEQAENEKKERLNRFNELVQKAMKETNCSLTIDFSSPLNDIRIVARAND